MRPRFKYWIFLFAIALAVFGVILGSFTASWFHLSGEERELVRDLSSKLIPFPFLGAVFLLIILSALVSLLFHYYIIPILQIAEETRLISVVNPEYRIKPRGAREVIHLTHILNESAVEFKKLRTEVKKQVQLAKAQLKDERNRLAALMAELPSGVLVCNSEGMVLLYNPQAQMLLQRPGHLVGLGRSLFSVLDREPIVHALDLLHQAALQGQPAPSTHFMMTIHEGLSLKINMAPVFSGGQTERSITGFVLTVENMTQQIETELQRDLMFHTLTEAMHFSTEEIRLAISTILGNPDMPAEELNDHRLTIDRASQAIEDQVQYAKADYARQQFAQAKTENVLGDYLLELVRKHLVRRLRLDVETHTTQDLWLKVNSFAIVQGLTQLGDCLKRTGIQGICLDLAKISDRQARLRINWPGCHMAKSILLEWQRRPLVYDAHNRLVSFLDLVAQHEGTVEVVTGGEDECESLHLTFPLAEPDRHWSGASRPGQRPIFYEFDLFNQSGWVELGKIALNKLTFVVFDTETTGLHPSDGDEIIQIGAIRIINGRILYNETIEYLVNPRRSVPRSSVEVHGISPDLLVGQPTIDKVLPAFHAFAEGAVLVAHNAAFDMKFVRMKERESGVRFDHPVLDTLLLSWALHPNQDHHSLDVVADRLQIPIVGRHTALGDAIVTAEVLVKLLPLLEAEGVRTLEDAIQISAASPFAKLAY
jgi:DNA polymerase III subunit epsilon